MSLHNDTFLRACRRQPVEYTPMWVMRQAGRYLPEYRALREKAGSFKNLCETPDYACEAAMQPLARYDLDAAILFSDILTIPDAMGLGLEFVEGEGPVFRQPIQTSADVRKLGVPDPEGELRYVMDAVRLIKQTLADRMPLIGFAGSPWTLATYMVEGRSSRTFSKIKSMLYRDPNLLMTLLDTLSQSVSRYLLAQIRAGVDAVMLFDTWGGILNTSAYKTFSLAPMANIIKTLRSAFPPEACPPIILFTKNASPWFESITQSGCDVVGVDWTIDLGDVKARIGDQVALQGNLDPSVLLGTPEHITQQAHAVLDSFGEGPGHIFNLGHGITPDVPPENVQCLVEAVKHTKGVK